MVDITLGRINTGSSAAPIEGLLVRLRRWRRRIRERAQLARLSARELRDLGVSPAQAAYEAGKPFWRA
jgi:uncharacterized protein YjiS (DUF1127 family)